MTNIKMTTTNDLLVYASKYMTMDVIYSFQLLISLQFTGISFSRYTIAFCGCYCCVLGILEVVVVSYKLMVLNATFNNILAISWWSVLLLEETWVPGENHRPVANHWQPLSHNVVSSVPLHERSWNSQLLWW